jgi:hypothetical protein
MNPIMYLVNRAAEAAGVLVIVHEKGNFGGNIVYRVMAKTPPESGEAVALCEGTLTECCAFVMGMLVP